MRVDEWVAMKAILERYFLLLSGKRPMKGDLDLGNNAIVNAVIEDVLYRGPILFESDGADDIGQYGDNRPGNIFFTADLVGTVDSVWRFGFLSQTYFGYDVEASPKRMYFTVNGQDNVLTLDENGVAKTETMDSQNYKANGVAGITQTVTIIGSSFTHTLTFTKGILTNYTKV